MRFLAKYQTNSENLSKCQSTVSASVPIKGLFNLINNIVASLYEGYEYDKYIVEKSTNDIKTTPILSKKCKTICLYTIDKCI